MSLELAAAELMVPEGTLKTLNVVEISGGKISTVAVMLTTLTDTEGSCEEVLTDIISLGKESESLAGRVDCVYVGTMDSSYGAP